MDGEIISQGAEAVLIKQGNEVLKRRVKKGYRISEIDEVLRRRRTKGEARLLEKAGKIVPVPRVLSLSVEDKEIVMEFIEGKKLSEELDMIGNWEEVCLEIGKNIAKLHDAGIIHGDLTTSNMLWKDGKVYFIDFGLGFANGRTEDKAVDLYLIKEALEAKHFSKFEEYFEVILKGYKESREYYKTLVRLGKVEKRGRYKQKY